MYNHWFITRQKRQLTGILPALICFKEICEGKVWKGNGELQLEFEDALSKRDITKHGDLRARKVNAGGGGIRTLFTQLKDLGLIFVEEKTKKAYEKGYSITGDRKRRMTDEYIPNVKKYANAKYPLAFFNYISTDFGKNINEQLLEIASETKINGSAILVEVFVKFAEDYQKNGYNHKHIKKYD